MTRISGKVREADSANPAEIRVELSLPLKDARALYDHMGTMPWAEGSWSNNLRSALSNAFGYGKLPRAKRADQKDGDSR